MVSPNLETRLKLESKLGVLGTSNAPEKEVGIKIGGVNEMEENLIRMARRVLRSGTSQAAALHANIIAFYDALKTKDDPDLQEEEPGYPQ